eukprot:RCo027033
MATYPNCAPYPTSAMSGSGSTGRAAVGTFLGTLLHPFATLRAAVGGRPLQQAQGTALTSYVGSTPYYVPSMGSPFMGFTTSPMTMAFGGPGQTTGSSGTWAGFPGTTMGGGMSGMSMGSPIGTTFSSSGNMMGSAVMARQSANIGTMPGSASVGGTSGPEMGTTMGYGSQGSAWMAVCTPRTEIGSPGPVMGSSGNTVGSPGPMMGSSGNTMGAPGPMMGSSGNTMGAPGPMMGSSGNT